MQENILANIDIKLLKEEIARREKAYKIREKASLTEIDAIFRKYTRENEDGKQIMTISDEKEAIMFVKDMFEYFYKKD